MEATERNGGRQGVVVLDIQLKSSRSFGHLKLESLVPSKKKVSQEKMIIS
jgi:hypothetical protein